MVRSVVIRSITATTTASSSSSSSDIPNSLESLSSYRFGTRCILKISPLLFVVISCGSLIWLIERHSLLDSTMMHLRATARQFTTITTMTTTGFVMTSSAFHHGEAIPSKYNTTISPPLQWRNPPKLTQSYTLIMEDMDTLDMFKHWIVYNIPSDVTTLKEGILIFPTGTVVLRNDHHRFRYDGPCPCRDVRRHRYVFRLVALSVPKLEIPSSTGRVASYDALNNAMQPYILQEAKLIGTYHPNDHD